MAGCLGPSVECLGFYVGLRSLCFLGGSIKKGCCNGRVDPGDEGRGAHYKAMGNASLWGGIFLPGIPLKTTKNHVAAPEAGLRADPRAMNRSRRSIRRSWHLLLLQARLEKVLQPRFPAPLRQN